MLYEITTKVRKLQKDGSEKEVTERYITDCELFAEAEHAGMHSYADYSQEGDVIAIKRSDIHEVVNESDDKDYYYKAKIVTKTIDGNANEKEQKYYVLIRADSLIEATNKANEYMKQGLDDMSLDGMVKTSIIAKI